MRREIAALGLVAILVLSFTLYFVVVPPAGNPQTSSSQASPSTTASASPSTTGSSSAVQGTTSSSSVASTSSQTTPAGSEGWTTYQADNARTGYYPVTNFTSVKQDWESPVLDGAVYAQPLVFGSDVFVATENDSVYSLDAASGTVLWRTNLGVPVQGGELQCGDISPSGITGTPVIDASRGIVYVVAFSSLHHTLFAVNATSGSVIFHLAADPPGFIVTAQQQRSALSLSDGMVYIPYGGLAGDCGQYHGWVVALPANGSGGMDAYQVQTSREGGIWAPSGAAVDSSGNVYVTTGNGASQSVFDYGNAVLKLNPQLALDSYFAPTDWLQLNNDDGDLGSVGPAIVGASLLFQVGKEGVGYLLNTGSLGGIGGQLFSANVCSGSYGGTAFSQPLLFVPCKDGLVELHVGSSSFSVTWRSPSFDAGPPVVTGGIVWSVDISKGVLGGFSVSTGHEAFSFSLGSVVNFCPLSAGDGRIFVPSSGRIVAFSLG